MIKQLSLSISVALLAVVGCGSPTPSDPTGTGAAGTTGTTGTAGSTMQPPPGFAQGGPYPFPQNKTSGSCTITTVPNAAAPTQNAYNSWKNTFVTTNGAGGFVRVQSPQHQSGTVSEGIAYGMIAAVYMSDRPTFD